MKLKKIWEDWREAILFYTIIICVIVVLFLGLAILFGYFIDWICQLCKL